MTEYHFQCPECGFDDKEAGQFATEKQIYCGLCAGDNGRDVLLHRWPATPEVNSEGAT
jgi:hypothetical protein